MEKDGIDVKDKKGMTFILMVSLAIKHNKLSFSTIKILVNHIRSKITAQIAENVYKLYTVTIAALGLMNNTYKVTTVYAYILYVLIAAVSFVKLFIALFKALRSHKSVDDRADVELIKQMNGFYGSVIEIVFLSIVINCVTVYDNSVVRCSDIAGDDDFYNDDDAGYNNDNNLRAGCYHTFCIDPASYANLIFMTVMFSFPGVIMTIVAMVRKQHDKLTGSVSVYV